MARQLRAGAFIGGQQQGPAHHATRIRHVVGQYLAASLAQRRRRRNADIALVRQLEDPIEVVLRPLDGLQLLVARRHGQVAVQIHAHRLRPAGEDARQHGSKVVVADRITEAVNVRFGGDHQHHAVALLRPGEESHQRVVRGKL